MSRNWKDLRELYTGHPQWVAVLSGVFLLVVLTGIHALLHFASGFNALYLLPIWLSTRIGGRLSGLLLVALCTVVGTSAEWLVGHDPKESLALDLAIRFVTLSALMLLIAQVEQALERQHRLAMRDPLTGLLNRKSLEQFGEDVLDRAHLRNQPVTVALLDCDHFKELNDTFGHRAGDEVLNCLARELEIHTRQADIVARIGGDEFAVILQNTTLEEAHRIMRRVDEAFVEAARHAGYAAGISIGYATSMDGSFELAAVLDRADRSMYRRKRRKQARILLT
ncbi:MAG TPA: GGDEF domain-containing protein [Fimbriimonadaceae bacterium]|nr:GGDEF domain-containing protein [Fimbriimonadaceae bacterium]